MWYVWSDGLLLDQAERFMRHCNKTHVGYEFKVVLSQWFNEPSPPHYRVSEVKYYQVEGRKVENKSEE